MKDADNVESPSALLHQTSTTTHIYSWPSIINAHIVHVTQCTVTTKQSAFLSAATTADISITYSGTVICHHTTSLNYALTSVSNRQHVLKTQANKYTSMTVLQQLLPFTTAAAHNHNHCLRLHRERNQRCIVCMYFTIREV